MATIIIPTPLRKFINHEPRVDVQATTVKEAINALSVNFPELKKNLLDDNGKIRGFVNLFVGDEDIRNLQQENTVLATNSVLSIIPAIAGGSGQEEQPFSKEELARYNRHIIIPDFGLEAQKKLKGAKVLVVGSGGLGSPLLLYLAAAGVGTIGIVDFDVVDDSNLQRQVLFGVENIGELKVEAAKKRLQQLNPYITIRTYNTQLTAGNALEIISQYDVIADGTDNFPTRYLVNDASVIAGKPNVYASIFQFEGQVAVFNYTDKNGVTGPNYRDLYPTPPDPGLIPNCAEGGVLGVLPGIIGTLQANEVIKVITGIGEPLSGRFFVFDALSFETRTLKISTNPTTPVISELIDYEQFCGVPAVEKPIKEISVEEFSTWITNREDIQVIDVREPNEYEERNIGALLIPLATVQQRANEIHSDKKVIVHCRSGKRSATAIRELESAFGFTNLYNLKGGILAISGEQELLLSR
ncbi:molybdopterin-synthase adenylyltransferase MoeB [Crocinitomicaceae bacterium CZZ-1]|uniref:Molybdopterin-synthase adenylyltransferase n=1 Tax=Taishania pollutisoli TaxID=2766479 RepID=A0A8J6PEQ2_9FLAO|nr:molybdopterin-synthase adenylyltransferase MoeB [Taishania pollutisoli]MBC9812785.1 molybdopterin-synthase adenylyltransferase MoeB [Taishania pollutisoli]